ncbi:MAG TPA: sulfonate ABC transporter ATP-binding protein [Agrobacterium sp.]|nr:sulfonate ABC transporter ATP-binding protein [Agrobacterium sp.]
MNQASSYSVVSARNLGLTFETGDGPVHALSNVDLEVGKGDFVSFIGPSGCGKTTFLRVIADLEKHTSGDITVNGTTPENARRDRSYGYVFQAAALYPWRSIEKNIALPLEIMGYTKAEQKERIDRTLDLVNLSGFSKKYPWQLSGGMQQRANLCRALIHEPDLLMLDEPFGALDAFTREELWCVIRDLHAAQRVTIILVTHDLREATFLADKIFVMSARPGRVLAEHRVPFARPRQLDIMYDKGFNDMVQELHGEIAQARVAA